MSNAKPSSQKIMRVDRERENAERRARLIAEMEKQNEQTGN